MLRRNIKFFICLYAFLSCHCFLLLFGLIGGFIALSFLGLFDSINLSEGSFTNLRLLTQFLFAVIAYQYILNKIWKIDGVLCFSASTLALISSIIGGIQLFTLFKQLQTFTHHDTYQVVSLFGHRNLFVEVLFLCLPFSIYGTFSNKGKLRLFHLVASLLSVTAVTVLLSRTIWLSLVAFIIVSVGLLLFGSIQKKLFNLPSISKPRKILWMGFPVLILAGLWTGPRIFNVSNDSIYFSNAVALNLKITEEQKADGSEHSSVRERIDLWNRSFGLSSQHPLFGHGTDNWRINILQFDSKGTRTAQGELFPQRPHNDFFWVSSEMGLVGLCCFLGIFIWTGIITYQNWKKSNDWNGLVRASLFFGGLVGYLLIASLNFPKERISHSILLIFMVLPLLAQDQQAKRISMPIWVSKASLLPLFIAGIFGVFRYKSERKFHNALNQPISLHKKIQLLEEIDPNYMVMDKASTPIAYYTGMFYFKMGDFMKAKKYFLEAEKVSPYHMHILNNLGTCYAKEGNIDGAKHYFWKTLSVNSHFKDAVLNFSGMLFNNGDYDNALDVIQRNINIDTSEKFNSFLSNILRKKAEFFLIERGLPAPRAKIMLSKADNELIDLYLLSRQKNVPFEEIFASTLQRTANRF